MKGLPTSFYTIYTKPQTNRNQAREQNGEQNAKREQIQIKTLPGSTTLLTIIPHTVIPKHAIPCFHDRLLH